MHAPSRWTRGGRGVGVRRRWVALPAALAVALIATPGEAATPTSTPAARPAAPDDDRHDLEPAEITAVESADRGPKLTVLAAGAETQTYLIRLADAAVPTYEGGTPGLAPTAPPAGEQLDPASGSVRAYREHLVEEQAAFVQRIERTIGRDVEVPFTYQFAVNGLAAVLTPEEAQEIALDPAVVSITPDQVRELHTDAGPQWSGAEALWNAIEELGLPTDVRGEGVVIGTIDTGISPGNRSFADPGPGDGFDHTNPRGRFFGVCNPTNPASGGGFDPNFPCNDKLIGAYVFGGANPNGNSALDYDGHGTHTSSTSGGNVVNDVVVQAPTLETPPFDTSGVAPHANVISYLACCTLAGLTAAINQAIADQVDVINYSIGSSSPSAPWEDFDTLGFLNARAAGIFVATSNGNDGPGSATTGGPADAPWLTSVGASTHDRHNANALFDLNSSAGPLADIQGESVTGALTTPTPIVDAAAFGDRFCGQATGNQANFTGRIVICERGGGIGRVQKSENVAAQGAVGFVLTNDAVHGDSLLGDEYALPGVFITNADGVALRAWLATGTGHVGAIAGTNFVLGDQFGDIMASFSSRGPNRAIETIVPSVTAPGADILAAIGNGSYTLDIHGFISGTSMSSPHVAGAGALLTQARPNWTPAQQQSALMTTARSTVLNHDGTPATPYAQGAGHIDVGNAARAGLLFDESFADYVAANPDEGGDPKTLNLPSFANNQCLAVCSWTRTATVPVNAAAPVPGGVTWTATAETDEGLALSVELGPATVSPGDTMTIEVTADVSEAPVGETVFGRIFLTPSNPAVPEVTMPLAVVPASGVLPEAVEVTTRRDAGSQVIPDILSIEVTEFTGSVLGMVEGTKHSGSLLQDPTRGTPYDNLAQVAVHTVEVPAGSTRLVAETLAAEMPDMDMFVGTGSTPSLATEVCVSATSASAEHCEVADPQPGTWWVLIQNWQGTTAQPDDYTIATAAVPGTDLGNAGLIGPEGTIPTGEPYDIRFHWDIPEMEAGDVWYGTGVLGSSPESPGDIGSFPITLRREGDDVAKEASVDNAAPGDTVSYDITIQPNVTPENLLYTIVDTVPAGLTIDPASVTGGGVVDGQTITWEVEVPSPAQSPSSYVVSTPATSPQCAEWGGFFDLATVGIPLNPALNGDTVAVTAFGGIGPFEQFGEEFPNLTVAEDGIVTVTGGYGGEPWEPQAIPNDDLPNGVFAPLWSDLELSIANGRGMRLAQSTAAGAAVVQWDNPFQFTPGTDIGPSVGRFQAWIYNSVEDFRPEMTFEYATLGALPSTATIGIEDILGEQATTILSAGNPASVLTPNSTYCLNYEGPSFDPITVGYDVTVDAGTPSGSYTNEVVHTTDDPFAEPVTVTNTLEVAVECTRVVTGTHSGQLNVNSGVTCLDGATVTGPVTIRPGAGLESRAARITGPVNATGATLVIMCDTTVVGPVRLRESQAVTLGYPTVGCGPNQITGSTRLTDTDGPSILAGNRIVGPLACTGNQPPPVNKGFPNTVLGRRSGQCTGL